MPVMRYSSVRRSNAGALRLFVFAFGPRADWLRLEVYFGAQGLQVFPQLKIAIGDLLLIDAIELNVLPQDEQQFLSPVPLQAFGNILRGSLHS